MHTSNTCSTGNCGCNPGLARRDFLKLTGLVAAGASLPNLSAIAGPFDAADFAYSIIPADKKLSAEWLRSLNERGVPTVYRGAELDTIGMPVGGICTGQLYLAGDIDPGVGVFRNHELQLNADIAELLLGHQVWRRLLVCRVVQDFPCPR